MSEKIRAQLVQEHGRVLRRIEIGAERAAEVAEELERLNGAVLDAAQRLDFNDDPGRFAAVLAAGAQAGKRK
jgi:hypothetical protein